MFKHNIIYKLWQRGKYSVTFKYLIILANINKMRQKILLLGLALILLCSVMVSAEIILSQPESIYNIGDKLQVSAEVVSGEAGPFKLNIICPGAEVNLYTSPNKKTGIDIPLTNAYFSNLIFAAGDFSKLRGDCIIRAVFLQENEESQKFKISDEIKTSLSVDNMSVDPGKEIIIRGSAIKDNGNAVEGFVEIFVENTEIKAKQEIKAGSFEMKFSFPKDAKSGSYAVRAGAYESVGEERMNYGEASTTLTIRQVPTKIEVAVVKQTATPGKDFNFNPVIYDQAGDQIEGNVGIKAYDVDGRIIMQKVISSGQEEFISLNANATPGYWKIEAGAFGLKSTRTFNVEELEKVEFNVVNDTLVIVNKGNVVYKRPVQVTIGDEIIINNVELDVGESKWYKLTAPDGDYNIKISDGRETNEAMVPLTGSAIRVKDLQGSVFARFPLVWLFLIAILGLFIFVFGKRVINRSSYAYSWNKSPEKGGNIETEETIDAEEVDDSPMHVPEAGHPERAEHSLALTGRKENSGILTVRINDLRNMKKACKETINSAIKTITENKGVIYETSDFLIGIFSSPTTKTFQNEMIAIRVSNSVENILKEHNRKMRQKLDFGISLNAGELIVQKDIDKIKFASMGKTIPLAKKIAELSRGEVLLSEEMQKKVMSGIKTEKEMRAGMNLYKIKEISDRGQHDKFIHGFLERERQRQKT